ncbi:hypothetical protein MMC12_003495 [Toensbergia leucococca]|nr:hypothetical protein [Toensbergia leucococca]
MLRLPSSRIGLSTRDLVWHTDRHHARQAQRMTGYLPEIGPHAAVQESRCGTIEHGLSSPPMPEVAFDNDSDESIVCHEPVPRDLRKFWENFLVDAGTVSGLPPKSLRENLPGLVTEPVHSSLENHGPLTASGERYINATHNLARSEDGYLTLESSENFHREEDKSLRKDSRFSSYSSRSTELYEGDYDQLSQESTSEETTQLALPLPHRHLSFISRHRRPYERNTDDDVSNVQRQFSSQMDLDGSSDHPDSANQRCWTRSSSEAETNFQRHGTRSDRLADLLFLKIDTNVSADLSAPKSLSPLSEPDDRSSQPQPFLPRPIEILGRRVSGLPRSPLYISQAAVSSSPEKRLRPFTNSSDPLTNEDSALLTRPPRRRRNYKPRSESYSFEASEAPSESPPPYQDLLENSSSTGPASSPPSPIGTYHGIPIHSSPQNPFEKCPAPPCNTTFNTPRRLFSPTHRVISSLGQTNPFGGLPYSPSRTPPRPPLRYVPSPSPPPPFTPHRSMPVYNDRLPPSSQPQTPARLPRHGVPQAAFTAPVHRTGHPTSMPAGPTTPTRLPSRTPSSIIFRDGRAVRVEVREHGGRMERRGRDADQENVSVQEEAERRMGEWRDRGDGAEGALERTPPGAVRWMER